MIKLSKIKSVENIDLIKNSLRIAELTYLNGKLHKIEQVKGHGGGPPCIIEGVDKIEFLEKVFKLIDEATE